MPMQCALELHTLQEADILCLWEILVDGTEREYRGRNLGLLHSRNRVCVSLPEFRITKIDTRGIGEGVSF